MEMYVNAPAAERTIFLDFPDLANSVDVFVYENGESLYEITSVQRTETGYTAVLPLHAVQHNRTLELRWELTYLEPSDPVIYELSRRVIVEVVTPILSKAEIRAIDSNVFDTNAEIERIEKAVRHVIQAYTGQEFGLRVGRETVRGEGGSALRSPRRIIELNKVNGLVGGANFSVDPEGHIVRYLPWGVPPVKADAHGLHMHTGGVIHNPNHVKWQSWLSNQNYVLEGRFGWEEVPAPVKEAAKLLVNDYACADSQYRDRYLTSMTAADWRIQFNSGAFLRTGNVRADQLLSEYVITRGWGVI